MKWYRNLYISEGIEKSKDEIISEICDEHKFLFKYLITLPANENNLLDIISAKDGILFDWREIYVIGVSFSKKEAVKLTSDIINEVYNKTGGFNLKEYFDDFI